jgi:hypothetical protein
LSDSNQLNDTNRLYALNSVAVHLALLRTGKLLLFSGHHDHIWNWNRGESSLWDPRNPEERENPKLPRNLFCSGHCFLADGKLFVAGGQSTFNHPITIPLSVLGIIQLFVTAADHDIHTFDPVTQKWNRHSGMPKARWYPTCVTLPDGKALIVSGTYSHAHHELFGGFMNLDYEIFDPEYNKLSKPVNFTDKINMYPFLKVLPGGTLFVHSEDTTRFWNIENKGFIQNAKFPTKTGGTRTYPGSGSCVLLPLEHDSNTAKILLIGGSTLKSPKKDTDASNTAEIFEVDLENPEKSRGWEIVESHHLQRFLCDSVLLPDGTVLVTNGAAKGTSDNNQVPVREVELFDPSTMSWKVVAYLKRDRLYHCSALLLPNGQVAIAGSTGHNWVRSVFAPKEHFEHNIEILTPPKLECDPNRPELDVVPSSISYNTVFEVTKNDVQIETVTLIKSSSTTHNNNMDQRCIILSIKEQKNTSMKLLSPKDNTFAPPGFYMLFILDHDKVPSVGKFVRVG